MGMSQEFDAIYERGVFRPLGPVNLPDQTKVHLQVQGEAAAADSSAEDLSQQKLAMRELLDWVSSRPDESTSERVSARDHDQILYGWQK